MPKSDTITAEGAVTDSLPNAMFKVKLDNGHEILAHISGKMRMNFIKILPRGSRIGGNIGVRPDKGTDYLSS